MNTNKLQQGKILPIHAVNTTGGFTGVGWRHGRHGQLTLLDAFTCVVVVVAEMQIGMQLIELGNGKTEGENTTVFSFQTFVKDTSDLVGGGAPEAEERVLPLLFSAFRG